MAVKHCLKSLLLLLVISSLCHAQEGYEREHRIRKSQFPILKQDLTLTGSGIKQQRFYKEMDNSQITYTMKFKQDRLRYFMDFNPEGILQTMGFKVKQVDFPSDTYSNIEAYLAANFYKVRIRRMYQEYPVANAEEIETTINNAFQNMLLPDNMYRLIFSAKKDKKRTEYEAYFDAEGNFMKIRQSLPANYDHILY